MRVLFLHNAFPGQYRHLAAALARDPANQVVFATHRAEGSLPGVRVETYASARAVRNDCHPYLRWMEGAVLTGQAVWRLGQRLKAEGFAPDVVCAHAGWGPGLYARELFPAARHVGYFEWFYGGDASDTQFLGHQLSDDDRCRLATRNAALLMDLAQADVALTPTRFQRDRFPAKLRPLLTVLHDGVDTGFFRPQPARPAIPGCDLSAADQVVTYATRGMEPYRGFPQFMRAAALLLAERPGLHVVIAGEDQVYYGERLPDGDSWKRRMLAELPEMDRSRLHFVGTLPAASYRDLLALSSAHVYLTAPFVLSWSLLDALACGCAVVGSDSEPVREVLEDGVTGLLADFFSPDEIAGKVAHILDDAALAAHLRGNARKVAVERFSLDRLLPRHMTLLRGN